MLNAPRAKMQLPSSASARKLPLVTLRRTLAALLFAAVAFAAALSVAPQLHAFLHSLGDRTTHECGATLLSSGNVEHSPSEPPPVARADEPAQSELPPQVVASLLSRPGCSRLEHAPPAQS